MTTICPTVTTANPHDYRAYMEQLAQFATRVHIDLSDGLFTPEPLIDLDKVWWPGGMRADLHVMFKKPVEHTELFLALGPQLVIVHAEAEGDFFAFADTLHRHGVEAGVALLPETPVSAIQSALGSIDHVLIFAGELGFQGGTADLTQLQKAKQLRELKSTLEISWDGGVTDRIARKLADGGVDVLNVGGFIAHAEHPEAAYATLVETIWG